MTDLTKLADMDPKDAADLVLADALEVLRKLGVPNDVQVDRMTTFAAGAHVRMMGKNLAAKCFRTYADRIDAGLFAASEPKKRARH